MTSIRSGTMGLLQAAVLLAVGAAPAQAEDAGQPAFEVSGQIDLVSDYRFRGISLSDSAPAVQPSLTVTHSSGLHAGLWGSNIADNGGDDIELDVSGGFAFAVGDTHLDIGGVYYVYPGAGAANYGEILASATRSVGPAQLGINAGYAPQQDALGGDDNLYLGSTLSADLVGPVRLVSSLGYENGAFGDNKLDWSAGIEADVGHGFTAGASYVDTARARTGELGSSGVIIRLSTGF